MVSTRRSVFSCQCFLELEQFLNTLLNLVSRCSKLLDWLAVWIVNKPVLEQLSRRPSFWKIYSAGLESSIVNSTAVEVMREAGIDISGQTSKPLSDFQPVNFDVVISLCGLRLRRIRLLSFEQSPQPFGSGRNSVYMRTLHVSSVLFGDVTLDRRDVILLVRCHKHVSEHSGLIPASVPAVVRIFVKIL